jgi:hypothetical protein
MPPPPCVKFKLISGGYRSTRRVISQTSAPDSSKEKEPYVMRKKPPLPRTTIMNPKRRLARQ